MKGSGSVFNPAPLEVGYIARRSINIQYAISVPGARVWSLLYPMGLKFDAWLLIFSILFEAETPYGLTHTKSGSPKINNVRAYKDTQIWDVSDGTCWLTFSSVVNRIQARKI